MGATWVPELDELAGYFGAGDELQLPQYFQFLFAKFDPRELRRVVEAWLAALPDNEVPVWVGSSHDLSRFPSRWCDGDDALIRTGLTMLLTLPGSCVLYQGDEFGLQDTPVQTEDLRDLTGQCRDTYRTPMPWKDEPGGGFTSGRPWLPMGDVAACNIADQMRDPDSVLHNTRRLIARKKALKGAYRPVEVCHEMWIYRRGDVRVTLDFREGGPSRTRVEGTIS